jgi:hypothetical protein
MSRKLNLLAVLFVLTVMVIAASSAQVVRPTNGVDLSVPPTPTLGCCKCLGGTNSLDLSTISSNHWTVNGNPVVTVTTVNPYWTINPGPANWVSTVANSNTNVSVGTYDYKLVFVVPRCSIDQHVTLSGNYGGDDDVYVYLDNTTPANLLSHCSGGWCFNAAHKLLSTFTNKPVGPLSHTLIVRVINGSRLDPPSPSGMFLNATLTGVCTKNLTKSASSNKEQ